jgi:Yip1-like protein
VTRALPEQEEPAGVPPGQASERGGSLARDLVRIYVSPGALFADLPRWNRSAAALVLLMALYALYGLAVLSTGVSDYENDLAAQEEIGRLPDQPRNDDNAEELDRQRDALEKGAVFGKMLARVEFVVGNPVLLAAAVGLLAGVLFIIVALWGATKPDYHVLAGVVTFAAYVSVPCWLVRLLLISQLHVSRVETSAAVFAPAHAPLALYLLLRRLDPFEVWFWALVGLGLYRSGQLSRRGTVIAVVVLALLGALCLCALNLPELAVYRPQPADSP